ncbi:MAG: hypothetical protein ACTSVT_04545 [Candidatus Thorarchaeota archaeon]
MFVGRSARRTTRFIESVSQSQDHSIRGSSLIEVHDLVQQAIHVTRIWKLNKEERGLLSLLQRLRGA